MVNKIYKRLSCTVIYLLFTMILFAQAPSERANDSMDAVMRSHDKIYVVMVVCIVILVILFLYLIRIDLKVSKKEKNL